MSFQMIGMYRTPEDVATFDHHYVTVHAPLAATLPGLRRFTMTHPAPGPKGKPSEYHLVSTLTFDDEASFAAALGGEVEPAGRRRPVELRRGRSHDPDRSCHHPPMSSCESGK